MRRYIKNGIQIKQTHSLAFKYTRANDTVNVKEGNCFLFIQLATSSSSKTSKINDSKHSQQIKMTKTRRKVIRTSCDLLLSLSMIVTKYFIDLPSSPLLTTYYYYFQKSNMYFLSISSKNVFARTRKHLKFSKEALSGIWDALLVTQNSKFSLKMGRRN